MTHYTKEQWMFYAKGNEIDREAMEAHLLQCDACMDIYLFAVDALGSELPELDNVGLFISQIQIESKLDRQPHVQPIKVSWFMKPIFQYTIAASITILLVGTGAFQLMFDRFSDIHREAASGSSGFSEQLTDQTSQWLDAIPAKKLTKKEGRP